MPEARLKRTREAYLDFFRADQRDREDAARYVGLASARLIERMARPFAYSVDIDRDPHAVSVRVQEP